MGDSGQEERKARGRMLEVKTDKKNSLFGHEAMGNPVWSKCLNQAERERI